MNSKALILLFFFLIFGSCNRGPKQAVQSRETDIHGIDVSHHQGTIDWAKVKEQMPNLEFVYVKASEGEDYVDPMFRANAKGASAQGLGSVPSITSG